MGSANAVPADPKAILSAIMSATNNIVMRLRI